MKKKKQNIDDMYNDIKTNIPFYKEVGASLIRKCLVVKYGCSVYMANKTIKKLFDE